MHAHRYYLLAKSCSLLLVWMRMHSLHIKWMCYLTVTYGCFHILIFVRLNFLNAYANHDMVDTYEALAPIWTPLAIALLFAIQRFVSAICAPHEAIGSLYIIIFRILANDVFPFMKLFVRAAVDPHPRSHSQKIIRGRMLGSHSLSQSTFLISFGIAMYLTVPPYVIHNTYHDTYADGKWPLSSMVQDLIELGILGEALPFDFGVLLDRASSESGTESGTNITERHEERADTPSWGGYFDGALCALPNINSGP